MNRIEFMRELSVLLQDISSEERAEAIQYYHDYFDDAGEENENQVIKELESPAKVAAMIKEGLAGRGGQDGAYGESTLSEFQVAIKDDPARSGASTEKNTKNTPLNLILILLIIVFGAPVILPLLGALVGVLAAIFAVVFALVVVSIAIMVVGAVLFFVGISQLIPAVAVGLLLCGSGIVVFIVGMIMTVGMVKLCMITIPPAVRGLVAVIRKPFQRKVAV